MSSSRFPLLPGFILGSALIGFFDGIVFHQILQWHHMICIEKHCIAKTVETMTKQNFYDGLFHAGMWLLLLWGLVLLTRTMKKGFVFSGGRFWGGILLGAGVFNVVEGIVDHYLLGIHHVRFGPNQPAWDGAFLLMGLALAAWGVLIIRKQDRKT